MYDQVAVPIQPKSSFKKSFRRFCFSPLLRMRARRLSPPIVQSLHDCASVMDFGFGDMILTEHLDRTYAKKVVGVDTIDSNLSNMPVTLYDGNRLPFDDKSIDASMVIYVLHHCQDIEGMLQELKRVSKKKIIIIEEVYKNSLGRFILNLHDCGNILLSTKMDLPCNFMTLEKWMEIFTKLNLTVNKSFRIYQYPMFNLTHQIFFELGMS